MSSDPRRLAVILIVLLGLCPSLAFTEDGRNTSTPINPAWNHGWVALFDGSTMDNWKRYRSDAPIRGWQIVGDALVRVDDGAGDIISTDQFDHFELEFEYKITPGGNSGVMFHVDQSLPQPWMSGPEIQILDNEHGADPQHAGWLYGLYKPSKPRWVAKAEADAGLVSPEIPDATRPAGQWNHIYLRVAPHQGEMLLNGVRYYRFQKDSPEWAERVKQSKFAAYPAFGTFPKGHICLQDHGDRVSYRNIRIRPLLPDATVPRTPPPPLPIVSVPAFPQLELPKSHPSVAEGKAATIRPIALKEIGNGDFVTAIQRGWIYRIVASANDATMHEIADLTDRVADYRKGNEEGLLGLALHPQYSQNGQMFVYYTAATPPRRSIVSRIIANDPPSGAITEEILLEIPQPFANHNGGSLAFGPDGYLYIGLGDGGSQNDPLAHGQNLNTLLGSVLRIDVDRKSSTRPYSIPSDNPFANHTHARPEIFAYGFRNVWQLSFDTKTGDLWAADVGQDRYEEIDRIISGGNYGWSLREGTLPFQNPLHPQNQSPPVLIEPIWQYDRHDGRSITGGFVYRGQDLASIEGHYLFADYVSGKIWALQLSADTERGIACKPLLASGLPVIAFSRDNQGRAYFLTEAAPEKAFRRLSQQSNP